MDVRTYLRAIRKSWWILLLAVVLGGVVGFAYSKRSTPVYAAHLGFFVTASANQVTNAQSSDQFAQSRAVSYARLLSTDVTAGAVLKDTDLPLSEGRLAAEISGAAELNTVNIDATVMDTSRARALTIAKSLARTFPGIANQVEPVGNRNLVSVKVVNDPSVGAAPVLPRTKLNTIFGLAGGLLVGLLISVLRFLRDTSVRTREDLENIGHAPVVGDIGYDSSARNAPLVLERQARSIRAEAYRQMRTNLQFVDAAGALHVIVVTSSTESEGKSTTATNLALMFAETGRSVLLVGADLRRPRVAEYLGLESAVGLTNVLVGQIGLEDALQPWGVDGMYVLASGSVPPNPSELLGSAAMGELLGELRRRFDVVIIDTPPLLPVTDAAVLAVHADGVVVVCRHGKTRRAQLATAVRALESVNSRIVGMVLNMRPARGPDSEHYGNYRYYDDNRRVRWYTPRLPARLRRARQGSESTLSMFPTPPLVEKISVPASVSAPVSVPRAPAAAPVTFEDRVGAPGDEDVVSDGALASYERRRLRDARGGRRAQMLEAIESRPEYVAPSEASPAADAATASPEVNGSEVNGSEVNGHAAPNGRHAHSSADDAATASDEALEDTDEGLEEDYFDEDSLDDAVSDELHGASR